MKKYNIITLAAIAAACALVACSHEEDDIFEQSAAERLNTVSNKIGRASCRERV